MALKRLSRYRKKTQARRARAFAEMAEIGKKQDAGGPSTGLGTGRTQNAE